MSYNTITEELLLHLVNLAKGGDDIALGELKKEGKRIIKAANSRLLRLEQKGFDKVSYAYGQAEYYNQAYSKNRFRINNKMAVDDIASTIREARYIINQPTSLVSGVKKYQDDFIETLDAYGIHVNPSDRSKFYEFVKSDTVQDLISYIGEYDTVMDIISNNINKQRKSFMDLYRDFNNALLNRETYDEFITRMSGGTDNDYIRMVQRHEQRMDAIRTKQRERLARRRATRKHSKKKS